MYWTIYRIIALQILFIVVGESGKREDSPPRITEHPLDVLVPKSSPAQMTCRAEGHPAPTIYWLKNNERLLDPTDPDDRYFTHQPDGTLFFLRVSGSRGANSDVGVYQCIAENSLGIARSRNATLQITFLRPEIRPVEATTTNAYVGEDVVLECTPPRGFPLPDVGWEKEGVPVEVDDRIEINVDHNLMITSVRKEDAGSYRCVATNMADTVRSAPSNLTVTPKPYFTIVPEDILAELGETVLFRCEVQVEVSEVPTPVLTWSKENGDLPVGRHEHLPDGSLQIRSIQEEDAGKYICSVERDQVYEKSAFLRIGDGFAFDVLPRDQTVSLNQDVELHCQAGGTPSPEIYWQDDEADFMLFAGRSSGRFRVDNDGTLHIGGIQEEDEGTYICYANRGSGDVQARAVITVIGATISPPPVISRGPFDQTLIVGSTAVFDCLLLEDTAEVVQWTRDDVPLDIANRYTVDASNTLRIRAAQVADSGRFSCIVSNSSGETSWSATLRVIENTNTESVKPPPPPMGLPESPTALQAVNITRNSVQLTWQSPFVDAALQSAVIGYRLEYYTPSTATGWFHLDDDIQSTSHVVTGLQPATPYVFLVRALNSKGIGAPSSVTQPVRTLDGDGLGSAFLNSITVDITRVVPLSPTAILLDWEVSGSDMSIDGFKIKCRPSSGGGMSILETVMGVHSHIVTGLVPDEDYTVSVQPFHGQRDGEESSLEAVRTFPEGQLANLPVHPDMVLQSKLNSCGLAITGAYPVSPTKLQLTWKVDRHGSYINGYHVGYFPAGDSSQGKIITVIGSRSLVLTGLDPWSKYTIVVRPFHGLHRGDESEPFAGRTAEDIPRIAPSSVHAVVNGSTLIVSWTPPPGDKIDGILTGYTVFCLTNITDADLNVTVSNANSAVKRVNGLTPSAVYRVMVAAHTSAGIGPASSPVIIQMTPVTDIAGGTDGRGGNSFTLKLIGILLVVVLVALLIILVLFCRRRHEKSAPITKPSLHYEPTTDSLTLSSNLHSQLNGTQQPLPPLPTDDKGSCHGNSSLLTTFSTTNGTLSSTVGRYWPTAPLNHSQAGPAYWLLEQQDPSYSCQGMHNHATLSSGSSTMSGHRARSPVYAVVDEEDLSQDGHCNHTLPVHQCTIVSNPGATSMPPQPYASTQLCPPQNIHFNTASRCSCGSSSNDTGCSTGTSDSQTCSNNKSASKKSNSESKQGPKSKPHRKKRSKHHHAQQQQQQRPANTWSEMLPPPPEEPPSDRTPCVQGPPYHFHTGSSNGGMSSQHHPHLHHGGMDAPTMQPVTCHECMKKTHDNMTLPAMHHYPSQYPPMHYNQRTFPHVDAYRGAPVSMPPGTRLDSSGGRVFQPISRPNGQYHQDGGLYPQNGVPHSSESPHYPMDGGHHLAPRQVFEDPRHAEIGEELLQYNDMMSQSEAQSDNEEGQPMLANITPGIPEQTGSLPAVSELSDLEAVRGDVDTDFDGSSYCTGSIMASGIGSCGEDEASEASEGESERFLNSYPSHQVGSLPMVMANGIQVGSQV